MKTISIAAALLLAGAASANAADLGRGSSKDPISVAGVTLTGFSVELGLGGGVTNVSTNLGTDASFSGFAGDVRLRLERELIPGWNVSAFGGISMEDVKGSVDFHKATQAFGYSAGLQLGKTFNKGTGEIYGLLGYAGQHLGVDNTGFTKDMDGLIYGGGIRLALDSRWYAGAEVDVIDYAAFSPATDVKLHPVEVRPTARLGVRF